MSKGLAPVNLQNEQRATSLVDDAYAAIKAAILDSSFAPGYQASEQEIALMLGMSRTPVHEAAIRLQEDGLVKVLPRRGILIRALAPDDMREIYDVVIAIEGRAAALICGLPREVRTTIAAVLTAHTDAMDEARSRGDLPAWGAADGAFHRALVESAGNLRLVRIVQMINDQSHRARMLTLKLRTDLDASVSEHRAIVASLSTGKPARAQAHAQRHRDRARDELLPLLASVGLKHL